MKSVATGLYGPHPLEADSINAFAKGVGPGAYALGRVDSEGRFLVSRVGRSDSDLNKRLHDHEGDYSQFKFAFYDTAKQAFERECQLYHDFDPPDNHVHPARPAGTNYSCPVVTCNL